MADFNIFKVLSKDDKELIHSSFFKFLIDYNDDFSRFITGVPSKDIKRITTEKGLNKLRFDLFIELNNGKYIVIENKFKSFPYIEQINEYDKNLKKEYPNRIQKKVLICFDSSLVNSDLNDWDLISYHDINLKLKKIISKQKHNSDEFTFIKHYFEFLNTYIKDYHKNLSNCYNIFEKPLDKEKKFWMRLVFSAIRNELSKNKKNIDFKTRGNSIVPYLNIYPKEWGGNWQSQINSNSRH